ncbi:MAG: DUF302 domain-containing protein [Cocleimonas sp.]
MPLIKKQSNHSVKDTMDKFEALVKTKDMTVFARVDHKANAASIDMEMNDAEVLIFGNPKGGTVIMKKDSAAALDLPLRVAVYADDEGDVFVSYHNQHGLSAIYDVEGVPVLAAVTEALDNLTNAVIG